MKILFLLPELPYPLTEGAVVKAYNIISHMAKNHECHIMSFGDRDLKRRGEALIKQVPGLKIHGLFEKCDGIQLQIKRVIGFIKGEPVFLQRWQTNAFLNALKCHLRTNAYDVIHLDALSMAPYVEYLRSHPAIISITDAISLAYKRQSEATHSTARKIIRLNESKKIAKYEKRMLPKFDRVHVVSRTDRDYLNFEYRNVRTINIEHAVPDSVLKRYKYNNPRSPDETRRILLVGGILSTPAVSKGLLRFLNDVYPYLYMAYYDLKFTIIGRNPTKQLKKKIDSLTGVKHIEWVDDYCAEHRKADVVVITDWTGTGIKTRLLYALALGCPVVASPAASDGFDFIDGVHLLKRNIDKSFADAVKTLLDASDKRQELSKNASQLISERFSKERLGSMWEDLYQEVISSVNSPNLK